MSSGIQDAIKADFEHEARPKTCSSFSQTNDPFPPDSITVPCFFLVLLDMQAVLPTAYACITYYGLDG